MVLKVRETTVHTDHDDPAAHQYQVSFQKALASASGVQLATNLSPNTPWPSQSATVQDLTFTLYTHSSTTCSRARLDLETNFGGCSRATVEGSYQPNSNTLASATVGTDATAALKLILPRRSNPYFSSNPGVSVGAAVTRQHGSRSRLQAQWFAAQGFGQQLIVDTTRQFRQQYLLQLSLNAAALEDSSNCYSGFGQQVSWSSWLECSISAADRPSSALQFLGGKQKGRSMQHLQQPTEQPDVHHQNADLNDSCQQRMPRLQLQRSEDQLQNCKQQQCVSDVLPQPTVNEHQEERNMVAAAAAVQGAHGQSKGVELIANPSNGVIDWWRRMPHRHQQHNAADCLHAAFASRLQQLQQSSGVAQYEKHRLLSAVTGPVTSAALEADEGDEGDTWAELQAREISSSSQKQQLLHDAGMRWTVTCGFDPRCPKSSWSARLVLHEGGGWQSSWKEK